MQSKQDFLGNEYKPGDYVIYAVTASQSINMIKAQVVEILDNGKVRLQPIAGSRWTSHRGKTYSVDTRTGKRINPWGANGKHIKEHSYYLAPDGKKYSMEEANKLPYPERDKITSSKNYVATVFHDYVETRTDPIKPVTISVTENIVKFADGELATEG
jgi:hypothetical protein